MLMAEGRICKACHDPYDKVIADLLERISKFGINALADQEKKFIHLVWRSIVPDYCPCCVD